MILSAFSALYPTSANILKVIGLLLIFKKVISLLISLYKTALRPSKDLGKRYGRNTWALVTGSSEGIGKAIAFSLAKRGFNIILSARTQFKLDAARIQILNKYPSVQVRTLPVDYSLSATKQYLAEKMKNVQDLDISIVVNNVGVDVLEPYHQISLQKITQLININCVALAAMNRIFVPKFVERYQKTRLRSAIVNVASLAGQIPMPYHNVYSASKAFADTFSRAISYQYSKKIDIISLNPSEVSTPMTHNKPKDIFTIMPQDCAQGLLTDLGHQKRTNGFWTHKLQAWLYNSVPESVFNYIWMKFVAPDFMRERQQARKRT